MAWMSRHQPSRVPSPTRATVNTCSRCPSGEMRLSCMLCLPCGICASPSLTPIQTRSIASGTMQSWTRLTSMLSSMLGCTTLPEVGCLHFIWGCLYRYWVIFSGCIGGCLHQGVHQCKHHNFSVFSLSQQAIGEGRPHLQQVTLSIWKAKYLSDKEEEPGLSSEDEATGLPPHRTVARHLLSSHGGVPMQLPAPQSYHSHSQVH